LNERTSICWCISADGSDEGVFGVLGEDWLRFQDTRAITAGVLGMGIL